ncbi:MAG: HAMP domain-containing protein [Solirubrobacterales bacterium]|nr:HAMP domain-containing protein [Solirubrobacterales bacterium]
MVAGKPSFTLPVPRRWRAARTIRLRLTALYTGVYLVSGAVLLTLGYLLVGDNLSRRHDLREALARHGLHPDIPGHLGFPPGSPQGRLVLVVEDQIRSSALHHLLLEYILALVAMTAIAVIAGWMLAGRALAPLREITATARRVSSENLGERIDLDGPADELRELADTFDGMLVRLDRAFDSHRQFVAAASHELRTPLAIMRTELDVALADPDASAEELREMGEAVREAIERSERLIASLLVLARSGLATGHEEPVDVAALAADCVTDLTSRAVEARVRIRSDLASAWVDADPELLERLIANLVANGIHHNEPGGELSVRTGEDGSDGVELVVINGGRRLDPEAVAALTEPFQRLGRSGSGFGLGLSIVRSVAEAHGGSVSLLAPSTGGLEVRVRLPRSRASASRPASEATDRFMDLAPRLTGS